MKGYLSPVGHGLRRQSRDMRKYVMVTQTENGPHYTWDDGTRLSTRRFTKLLVCGQLKASEGDNLFSDTPPQVFWVVGKE